MKYKVYGNYYLKKQQRIKNKKRADDEHQNILS